MRRLRSFVVALLLAAAVGQDIVKDLSVERYSMAERTIYTCDLCKKETASAIPKGQVYYQLMIGSLNFHSKNSSNPSHNHTCNSCLDILARELDAKFEEVISKLYQDLMG